MMKKQILALMMLSLSFLMIGSVFATAERVTGDANLDWSNAYDRPQLFVGDVTGDLIGDITLTTNTDYDSSSDSVGATWSEDMVMTLQNGTVCEGFYAGSTVNQGTNAGTFTLYCDDGNIVQGIMHGTNDAEGNIDLSYSAFLITPTPGPQGEKGDTGETGLQGEQGLPGQNGLNGIDGQDGSDGVNGQDGTNGEQGLPGSDANVDLNPLTNRVITLENFKGSVLSFFTEFSVWFNSPQQCTNGELRCAGNSTQKCVNYAWSNLQNNCPYGCANGVCNQAPQPKCPTGYTFHSETIGCNYFNGIYYGQITKTGVCADKAVGNSGSKLYYKNCKTAAN